MIEIIFENEDWLPFFKEALNEINVPFRLNKITEFQIDLNQPPDNIIFLNRISPSSHTRGNQDAFILGEQYLEYLATYNRTVINDYRTINYELSKVEQIQLLKRHGLAYPKTSFGSEKDELVKMAHSMPLPFLTKHNCSGKGLGIHVFNTVEEFEEYINSDEYIPSPDGILLLQEYIKPKDDRITRVEIIDGELVYAFHSSTAQGFELCPADACRIDVQKSGAVCEIEGDSLFTYLPDFKHQIVSKYIEICQAVGFDMAGIEFVEAVNGAVYTYDINGTTNYSPDIEKASGDKAKIAFQQMIQKRL
ncbi:MAG: alpha-L-glutamate ligase [Calditrichaeota bacterium]|nr:MAG: alpha-L-glutamate ligase [Calditrichota bacterium]